MFLHNDSSITNSNDEIDVTKLRKQNISLQKHKSYCIVCNKHYFKEKLYYWYS